MNDRPWVKNYDKGVPATIEYPSGPVFQFLDNAAQKYPDRACTIFKGAKITQIHGQMRKVADRFVIAMYHPAAALHQISLKPAILADFAKLPELLNEARAGLGKSASKGKMQEKKEDDPKQMNLF